MATHGSMVNTSPAGIRLEGVSNHYSPYRPDLVPSDFHFFFTPQQIPVRFQNDIEAEMSVTMVPIAGGRVLRHRIQK